MLDGMIGWTTKCHVGWYDRLDQKVSCSTRWVNGLQSVVVNLTVSGPQRVVFDWRESEPHSFMFDGRVGTIKKNVMLYMWANGLQSIVFDMR